MMAGVITPPKAAAMGTIAVAGDLRSPIANSFLSSRPVRKKNIAKRPSAAQVPIFM